ncbi:MAG: hypothetical protein ACE5F7_05520 [Nitrospiria bacterium]
MSTVIRAILVFLSLVLWTAPQTLLAEDRTILLDESLIVGTQLGETRLGRKKRVAGPALSTELLWEGEAAEAFDIPKEILDHLTQSDLSFFKNREIGRDDDFESLDEEDDLQ